MTVLTSVRSTWAKVWMSTPVDKMQKWMAGILVRDLFTLSLRVKAFAYVLYDEITRPDLRLEYSRFEWYCNGCSTHHWEDMPTTNSASIRTYLAAYGISKPLLHNWAPRRYRVLNGESGQEDGLVHGSTDIASMYHELDSLLEFSSPIDDPESVQSPAPSADNPYLYLLQNPRGQWGKFRIIEVDSSSMPLQVVSIETLKEAYNATRGPWSKLLYGEPIATGLLKFIPSEDKVHAVTQYQKAKNARISSFSFMLWWKREQDGGERRLTSCLPFDNRSIKQETCFDRRKPFTGIYLIHDPRWITWLYAGLMIALIGIFGGLAYTRSDPEPWMFLLIVAAAVVTLLYTKIWKWSTRFESELRMEF